jgi:hypothetical protein
MIQVSLIGFSVGGTFLSLLYFDVPYYLMTAMVVTRVLIEKELKEKTSSTKDTDPVKPPFGPLNPPQSQPITRDSG